MQVSILSDAGPLPLLEREKVVNVFYRDAQPENFYTSALSVDPDADILVVTVYVRYAGEEITRSEYCVLD